MALGMMPGATYDEQHQDLQPGEMLIIYSDGLTEALNEAGEFYGDERLRAVFAGTGVPLGETRRATGCSRRSMPSSATPGPTTTCPSSSSSGSRGRD